MQIKFTNQNPFQQTFVLPLEQEDCKIIYCYNDENNNCPYKDSCKRYTKSPGNESSTLYKSSCTEDNNYQLYIKDGDFTGDKQTT